MSKQLLKAGITAGVILLAAPVCAAAAAEAKDIDTPKQGVSQEMNGVRKDARDMSAPDAKSVTGEQPAAKAQDPNEAAMERIQKEEDKQSVGEYLDDAGITAKVKSKFVGQEGLDSFDIKVVTVDGAVTLMGEVDTQAQVDLAGKVAQEVGGVKKVDNKLTVKK